MKLTQAVAYRRNQEEKTKAALENKREKEGGLTLEEKVFLLVAFHDSLVEAERMTPIASKSLDYPTDADGAAVAQWFKSEAGQACLQFRNDGDKAAGNRCGQDQEPILRRHLDDVKDDLAKRGLMQIDGQAQRQGGEGEARPPTRQERAIEVAQWIAEIKSETDAESAAAEIKSRWDRRKGFYPTLVVKLGPGKANLYNPDDLLQAALTCGEISDIELAQIRTRFLRQ